MTYDADDVDDDDDYFVQNKHTCERLGTKCVIVTGNTAKTFNNKKF